MRLMSGTSQTANTAEWYDKNGTLAAYMRTDGGLAIQPALAQPACSSSTRFTLWTVAGGAGVKDSVQVCAKDAADAYAWRTIY
jgi:hypothetical protein